MNGAYTRSKKTEQKTMYEYMIYMIVKRHFLEGCYVVSEQ